MSLGGVIITNTTDSVNVSNGGAFLVAGGASISKDLYIGGNLYVNGVNNSPITGNVTIGNSTDTSVNVISGISIGKTMPNTNYKIFGNLQTTSDNTNVYNFTFKNLTTSTFDVAILRADSLFSGWTDPNLILSWIIYQ